MASNTAAWLTAEKARPFEVKAAPMWTPSSDEILVKNHAVAIQPVDNYIQALAFLPLEYPTILGHDIAGEVVEVGSNVKRFKKGDRVLGQALGVAKNYRMTDDCNRETAFQAYTIMQAHSMSKLPGHIPYENGAVLPCCLTAAAIGLFSESPYLHLQFPTEPAQKPNGKTVLIWGGASNVGSSGIQMAVAAGYEVVTTASPKNFDYVKKLGAKHVFDYRAPSVVDEILDACKGKTMAGVLDCIGGSATTACMDIAQKVDGSRAVATVKPEPENIPEGVTVKFVMGAFTEHNAVAQAIWVDFVPKALEAGSLIPAPEPHIVGKGLESVQTAVDLIEKGVSASKLVVTL